MGAESRAEPARGGRGWLAVCGAVLVTVVPSLARADAPSSSAPERPPTPALQFGTYGRVRVAGDLEGAPARPVQVTRFGSRLDEESYVELEVRREDQWTGDIESRIVTTVGLFPPFFHVTGQPEQGVGVRNLYLEVRDGPGRLWAGSRMWRGDDLYLFDWWPLDELNLVGAGGSLELGPHLALAAHGGAAQPESAYFQQREPTLAAGPYADSALLLDRHHAVGALELTLKTRVVEGRGAKLLGYTEVHRLASGTGRYEGTDTERPLPGDRGVVVGAQLTHFDRRGYAHAFLRHARGLATTHLFSAPVYLGADGTTAGATETTLALGGGWARSSGGLLAASYLSFVRDASPAALSAGKYDEGALVVRPYLYLAGRFGGAFEGALEARRTLQLDVRGVGPLLDHQLSGALILFHSPAGRGLLSRPELRLFYRLSALDLADRAEDLPREHAEPRAIHLLGAGAEWWFNSSSYR